ncbi:MAG: AAA family ATPase [Gemmatimonadales bacterium]
MSEPFYLKCLGTPELFGPDGRVVRMKGQKHLALLVYLAVERRTQYRRDELAHLLWAEHEMPEARHSLATALSAIRRVFGPTVITGNRDLLRFEHRRVILDVERLESQEVLATDTLPAVEIGGFLADTDLRAPLEYLHWRDRQQARWQPYIKGGLLKLIDHCRRTGASRQIGRLADQLIALDSLAEDGPRAKMEALAFAGDRISALRVFEEWRERLKAELGAVPSPLVEEMARRLRRRGVERPVADPSPSVQVDPWRDRPFVGRAHEYRVLYEAWESVKTGTPRHALVEGESGIGKSTLVERFAVAASLEGAIVARAQCYELERAIPFAALAALTMSLLDKPGVASTHPASLAEVARVVPKVRERFPGLPAPMDSQGETARLHFAEGVMAMLEAAMEEHPVVLVVDDFHLADEVSLTVLHLLIRRIESARLMVLLTIRTSELRQGSGAARIHGGGEYLRMARLLLPPLTEAECHELLARLVPPGLEPPAASHRRALMLASRGVPMVLQLLVDDWQRNGAAGLAMALGAMTERVGPERALTSEGTYRHIIERMLSELDPVTRLVLHTATILGSRINDLGLYQVSDLTTSQTMMGMAELTSRYILRDSPTGLDFVNELVRGQAYGSMPGPLRLGLHAAVAQRLLARLAAGEKNVPGLETAWHLARGGRAGEAAPHLLRGGREAIHEGAPHEAELALSTALADDVILRGDSRTEALLLHSEVLQELSMWRESIATLTRVPDDRPLDVAQAKELLEILALHHIGEKATAIDRERVIRLLHLAASSIRVGVRARAASSAAQILEEMQVALDRRQIWESIEQIDGVSNDPEVVSDLLVARATLWYDERNTPAAIQAVETAVKVLKEAQIASTRYVNLVNGLSALNCSMGNYRDGEQFGEEAFKLASRLDNTYLMMKACANLCIATGRQGNYRAQEKWGRLALTHLRRSDHSNIYMRFAHYIAEAMAMMGARDALAVYSDILNRVEMTDNLWGNQAGLLNEADLLQLMGKPKRALAVGRTATTGQNEPIHNRGWAGKYARWITLIALESGDTLAARRRLGELISTLDSQDKLDQIEIALSFTLLDGNRSQTSKELKQFAMTLLADMPAAVSDRLQRLAILRSSQA